MITLTLNPDPRFSPGPVSLPPSKSIAARMIVMRALSGFRTEILSLPDCDDTVDLQRAIDHLFQGRREVVIRQGAASLRFFIALAAASDVTAGISIKCHFSLLRRPLDPLISALSLLFPSRKVTLVSPGSPSDPFGYIAIESLPSVPSAISTEQLDIPVDTSLSSQFLSALMMSASISRRKVRFLFSDPVSSPYIKMTASVMRLFGASVSLSQGQVVVSPVPLDPPASLSVEPDWSAAAFIFETAILCPGVLFRIPGLSTDSIQGDAAAARIFSSLGISLFPDQSGLTLRAHPDRLRELSRRSSTLLLNMRDFPDLVPPLAVALSLSGIHFRFSGVAHLRVKESDRIRSLSEALRQLGVILVSGEDSLSFLGQTMLPAENPLIDPALDHRIAMALAPAVLCSRSLRIKDHQCVAKSFPLFWLVLQRLIPVAIQS